MVKFFVLVLLYWFMFYSACLATTYLNVQDSAESESQELTHTVSRVSTFKYTPKTSVINYDSSGVNIAAISVVNNTIDGFTLSVSSAQGGVLAPDSTDDGEQDIPFSLSLEAVGSQGTGVDSNLSIAQTALGDSSTPTDILAVTGEQSSPTSVSLEVNVVLDSTVEDQMSMAGAYADTLTFTYTDL